MEREVRKKKINPYYVAYDDGRIWSNLSGKFLNFTVNNSGLYIVQLKLTNGRYKNHIVSKIIAELFVENPDWSTYKKVIHIDGNKLNNDYTNLKWVTENEMLRMILTNEPWRSEH